MTGIQTVLLAVALTLLAIGAYSVFVLDEVIGVVLMALATAISALSAVIGAQSKKNNEETGDAG